jgi:uncharacterized delta-60 repeat protein
MKFLCLTVLAVVLPVLSSIAQSLSPDYQFKTAGKAFHRLTTDQAGNTFVFGSFDHLNGKNLGRLLKLDAAGSPVAGFKTLYADDMIFDLVIQPDNKILISGYFTQINGKTATPILRLNADGSIDDTFSCPLTTPGNMELQSTGKIIVFTNNVFERLNTNGSIDLSFGFQNYAYSSTPFKVAPDNSIFFASLNKIFKLTANGLDDVSFQTQFGSDISSINALEIQTDGKVLGGSTTNGSDKSLGIFRLILNGTLDPSFNPGEVGGQVFEIGQRANGKIIFGGQFTTYDNQAANLVELNPDGTLFRIIATVAPNWITSIVESPDSKITIAGEFSNVNGIPSFGTWRFNANYTKDESFYPKITLSGVDGIRLIVNDAMEAKLTGDFDFFGIYNEAAFVKGSMHQVNPYGAYDLKYKSSVMEWPIYKSEMGKDGKVYVAGYLGTSKWELIRLNKDGSKDPSFNTGTGATRDGESQLVRLIKDIDSQIFVSGDFSHFNGVPSGSLVGLNQDGSVAQTFTTLPANAFVHKIRKQSNGKLVLLGNFNIGGRTLYLIRLNKNGTIDESFHRSAIAGNFADLELDKDDNIYMSGESFTIDGASVSSLAKFTPNGLLDGSFNVGSGFRRLRSSDGYLYDIEILPDRRIAVGGYFDSVQGIKQSGFAILNENGTLLPQSQQFFGNGSAASAISYKNGQLFIAGRFTKPDFTETYGLTKVHLENVTTPPAPSNLSATVSAPGKLAIAWTTTSSANLAFVVERAVNSLEAFVVVDTVASNVKTFADEISPYHYHTYRVRAINEAGYSHYSNVDSVLWKPAPMGSLTLTATFHKPGKIVLAWTGNVQYHDGYRIERSVKAASGYEQIATVGAAEKSFTDMDEIESRYYRVVAYNSQGVIESTKAFVLITGVEYVTENDLEVYPNPATDHITVKITDHTSAVLSITDGNGRVVKETPHLSKGANPVDIAELSPGVYHVKIKGNKKQPTIRVIKR